MATTQANAIDAAQQLIGFMQTFKGLRAAINDFVSTYTNENYSTVWAAMATAALNADGSLGTPDGSPNTAHPITAGNINRSQTALVAGVVFIEDFQKFLTNQAVSTGNRTVNIDDLVS